MKNLFGYFKGYWSETILAPLFKLLEAGFELLVPLILAKMVDEVIPSGQPTRLLGLVASLLGLALVGGVVALLAQYFSAKSAIGFTRQLNQDLFTKLVSLPQSFRDQMGTSYLISGLTVDTLQIQTGINLFLRLFLRAPIIVFGAILLSFRVDVSLASWFILMVSVLILIVWTGSRVLNPIYGKIRQILDRLLALTREQLEGMRVIRAFNQADVEQRGFGEVNQFHRHIQLRAIQASGLISPLTFLVVNLTLILILWLGGNRVGFGQLSQGQLLALVNYLLQILAELLKMMALINSLNQASISAKRVQAILEAESENLETPLPIESNTEEVLVVEDLSFTYPQAHQPALQGLHFRLKKGESLGIIGGTGSGKTSLVKLLSGLYQPTQGCLHLFEADRSPANLGQWRSWLGIVPQQADLFKGTIASNLNLGQGHSLPDNILWQALKDAQAKDFVIEKGGLESQVESFGRNFSGGQRQRLSLARSFVYPKAFLILDDATSALDYLTEKRILDRLPQLASHLIMVSQRTRSLEGLDKILVLDQGRQVGFGSHQDLLETCPLYQEIYESQQSPIGGEQNEG